MWLFWGGGFGCLLFGFWQSLSFQKPGIGTKKNFIQRNQFMKFFWFWILEHDKHRPQTF